ncbi:glycosyltransferase family 4 protein [Neobacillus mesonae]|uniref:glycosyltransferase family 4 protein n=1 Tax=Neobacillus mesonae TaxID=1193713 RepID=UPI002E2195AB|nr:glycosyltransferase family 4 protein [Neobacillus mesonae]
MKILIASFWPLPQTGGIWSYVKELRQGLIQMGHKVDILSNHQTWKKYYLLNTNQVLHKEYIKDYVTNVITPQYHFINKDAAAIINQEAERYSFELAASFFDLQKYDLIHTQDIISARALSRVKPKDVPLLTTIHGCRLTEYLIHVRKADSESDFIKMKQSIFSRYLALEENLGIISSDLTIVPSNWLKNVLIKEYSVSDQQISVIPYGIDINQFIQKMEQPSRIPSFSGNYVIGCIARLDRVKGHITLLEALAKLKQERSDWVCWLIGEGSLRRELKLKTKQLGLQHHILFLGNQSDIPSILKQMDIFVLPSLQDNYPFALMEAMASGKPVVVTDAGGMPEMVTDNKTGLISPKGDSSRLYTNIKRLVESEALRKHLANQAKEWSRSHWKIEQMIHDTAAVYQQLRERKQE